MLVTPRVEGMERRPGMLGRPGMEKDKRVRGSKCSTPAGTRRRARARRMRRDCGGVLLFGGRHLFSLHYLWVRHPLVSLPKHTIG